MLATETESREKLARTAQEPTEITLDELYQTIRNRMRFIGGVTMSGATLAAVVACLIPNKYTSTAQLMPPDQQSISSSSMVTPLSGVGAAGLLGSGAGGFMTQRTPGQTVLGILKSNAEVDHLIDEFNLRTVYNKGYVEDARKALLTHSDISEDKKSGILQIDVTNEDKVLAHNIATAYVDELNKIVNYLGTSSAHRERIFLEQRLEEVKTELDASTLALGQFSSLNATMDIQKQGAATMEAASRLQAQLIEAEGDLSALKTRYARNSLHFQAAQARIDELHRQLNSISGAGRPTGLEKDQIAPSIRKLPLLGAAYSDFYRRVMIQETLYETLSKQYELARVEEAKEIPPIRVLSPPSYPEKNSGPHRSIIIALGAVLSWFASTMWVLAKRYLGTFATNGQAG